jgi:ribosome biogenesis protein ENP2
VIGRPQVSGRVRAVQSLKRRETAMIAGMEVSPLYIPEVCADRSDLRQYDPRTVLPSQQSNSILPPAATSRPRPRLIVGSGDTAPRPRQETFGSRLQSRPNKGKLSSRTQEDDGVLATRRSADGGMEMSFIPQKSQSGSPGGQDENDEYSGGTRRKDRKIERFGAGMEKGQEEEVVERGGRTRRRDVGRGRSASKNAFRRR